MSTEGALRERAEVTAAWNRLIEAEIATERRLIIAYLDRRDVRVRTKGASNIVAREIEKGAHRG